MELDGIRKTLHQIDKIRYRPSILRKIAYGYFRTLVLRKPTLRIIEFSITPACQSRCTYCYASKMQRNGEPLLSVEEIRDTWLQAKKLGAFTGFVVCAPAACALLWWLISSNGPALRPMLARCVTPALGLFYGGMVRARNALNKRGRRRTVRVPAVRSARRQISARRTAIPVTPRRRSTL